MYISSALFANPVSRLTASSQIDAEESNALFRQSLDLDAKPDGHRYSENDMHLHSLTDTLMILVLVHMAGIFTFMAFWFLFKVITGSVFEIFTGIGCLHAYLYPKDYVWPPRHHTVKTSDSENSTSDFCTLCSIFEEIFHSTAWTGKFYDTLKEWFLHTFCSSRTKSDHGCRPCKLLHQLRHNRPCKNR